MEKHLYFSLLPEALIASMLPPVEFGNYLAIGTRKRTRGQAIFFEVESDLLAEHFPLERINEKLVLQENGEPKRSVYLSIYRVLEKLPLESLGALYLTTDDGKVLKINQEEFVENKKDELHLYQQISPITPRIASRLNPTSFLNTITDISKPISVPKLVFVELILNSLAQNPDADELHNLPYQNFEHLKDCLKSIKNNPNKHTKTVIRFFQRDLLYRTIKNGLFIGEQNKMLYYPFPSREDLEGKYYSWWKSAQVVGFG